MNVTFMKFANAVRIAGANYESVNSKAFNIEFVSDLIVKISKKTGPSQTPVFTSLMNVPYWEIQLEGEKDAEVVEIEKKTKKKATA